MVEWSILELNCVEWNIKGKKGENGVDWSIKGQIEYSKIEYIRIEHKSRTE